MAFARNNAIIQSAQAQAAQAGEDATIVTLWDAATSGNLLQQLTITGNPDALVVDARYRLAVGALVIEQKVATGETQEMAKRALRGRVSGGIWIQWHDGAPGTAGTSNVVALARTQVTQAQFSVTDT